MVIERCSTEPSLLESGVEVLPSHAVFDAGADYEFTFTDEPDTVR